MAKDQSPLVKDAIYKLQLSLLEGIQNQNQLSLAGSLMSRSDYEDAVIERSVANLCGYPLCHNPLPTYRPRKGRFHISWKDHKLYDLEEEYKYCSPACVLNSHAFAGSLQAERCSVLNEEKLDDLLRLFGNLGLESKESLGKNGDLGLSDIVLRIEDKLESKVGDVSAEEWMGSSSAIEGYVPKRYGNFKPSPSKNNEQGSLAKNTNLGGAKDLLMNEIDFMSTIIANNEYSISKNSLDIKNTASNTKLKAEKEKVSCKESEDQFTILETSTARRQDDCVRKPRRSKGERSGAITNDNNSVPEVPSTSNQYQPGCNIMTAELGEKSLYEKAVDSHENVLKPSLKHPGMKKTGRTVTWADEKTDGTGSIKLQVLGEMDNSKEYPELIGKTDAVNDGDGNDILRFSSAEACATALSQAAEAVASGEAESSDAVSEAGIIILPPPTDANEKASTGFIDTLEPETVPVKWPRKTEIPKPDLFDPEDSWYDAPPEGFNLTLSPFATMWMALFAWITSSTLAYTYGRDETFHEENLSVNGREYPRKIVSADGHSSEIKRTLAGCLARALPGLVAELRLPTPISSLEQGMGHLLDTMTFLDALPAFRMKQWQVIILLFLEALSVCRIPSLASSMTSRRMLLHKVLDGSRIRGDEYEVMRDLLTPLGRVPEFSAQNGA